MTKGEPTFICDAGTLISLTDTCFVNLLYMLKNRFNAQFIIPRSVYNECIGRPMKMRSYAIHALRMNQALEDGILKLVADSKKSEVNKVLKQTNKLFFAGDRPLELVHRGEAGMIALADRLGVDNLLMDERTTRTLIESPMLLHKHLEKEFHRKLRVDKKSMNKFLDMTRKMKVFRSSEILVLAYENEYFKGFNNYELKMLEASLNALKLNGCAISFNEIKKYVKPLKKK